MSEFHPTASSYRPGARTLEAEYYTSPAILAEERERIFARGWCCVGRAASLPEPGDYALHEIAGESLIVLRDRQRTLRAFFNVCRHRGTRICVASAGRLGETLQCPYHAWTYALDGRLVGAPHMQEVPGFDRADYPLHPAAVAEWEGFLFVNLAERPEPFERAWAPFLGRFARFGLGRLAVGHRVEYDVRANWKLVFQNYSECLHCPTLHPELSRVLPYQSGANDLVEGPFLGGTMEIRAPHQSATLSGRACARPIADPPAGEVERLAYYYTAMPDLLLSIHPDYVNYYRLRPLDVDRTEVMSEWLFHPESLESGADLTDAIEFWDLTNRQDWEIVARSQRGVASRRYAPGPYSARESLPAAWDREYLRWMGRERS